MQAPSDGLLVSLEGPLRRDEKASFGFAINNLRKLYGDKIFTVIKVSRIILRACELKRYPMDGTLKGSLLMSKMLYKRLRVCTPWSKLLDRIKRC